MSNRFSVSKTLMISHTSLHSVLTHVLTASSSLYSSAQGRVLTCDADVGLAALGGSGGAPGHALTPVIFGSKQLLHLLSRDLYTGFSHHQTCRQEGKTTVESFTTSVEVSDSKPKKIPAKKKKKKKRWMSHKFRLLRQQLILKLLLWRYGFHVSLRSKCQSGAQ